MPEEQGLGVQFLVRFKVGGEPVATVRQKDVEQVFCPSPMAGTAPSRGLTDSHPTFRQVPLSRVGGTARILAPVG